MKQARKLAVALAVGAAFIGMAGMAQAQSALVVDFNAPTYFEFRGSFTYDGKVYGPSTAIANTTTGVSAPSHTSIDLEDFAADTLYLSGTSPKLGNDGTYVYPGTSTPGNAVVYRFYRQEYSGIAANLTKGVNNEEEERQHFVKAVVGEKSTLASLLNLPNNQYTYNGVAFSNFPQGNFSYTVDLTTQKGYGSFTLDALKVPGSVANQYYPGQFPNQFYTLNVAGTLASSDITSDGGIAVVSGAASAGAAPGHDARLYDAITQASQDTVNPVYNLTFFGPNAEEVAGRIQGLPDRIGGVAIIGKR